MVERRGAEGRYPLRKEGAGNSNTCSIILLDKKTMSGAIRIRSLLWLSDFSAPLRLGLSWEVKQRINKSARNVFQPPILLRVLIRVNELQQFLHR